MLQNLANNVTPVETTNFDVYHSNWFNGGNSFWGRDVFAQGSQAIAILGEVTTQGAREHPLYLKPPIQWQSPGLLFMNTSFESDLLKENTKGLENTLLHFLFLNFQRERIEVEIVFDRKFSECAKELSQRDFVNYLQIYRTNTGLNLAVSTSEVTSQYFLGYWQSLEENKGFSAQHDPEGIARGHGDKTYYCMGPLQRITGDSLVQIVRSKPLDKKITSN